MSGRREGWQDESEAAMSVPDGLTGVHPLTREQLYELVWTKPLAQVAKALGGSERALAQACTRYQIPRPRASYWTRLAVGHAPARRPLPQPEDPQMSVVVIGKPKPLDSPPAASEPIKPEAVQAIPEKIEFQSKTIRDLYEKILVADIDWSVPKRLTSAFPAVEEAAEGLRASAKQGRRGSARQPDLLVPSLPDPRKAKLDIRVARGSIDRVARVAQALIVAAVDSGFRFQTERDNSAYRNEYFLELCNQRIKFSIGEISKRTPHIPTPKELAAEKVSAFDKPPNFDYTPTGLLRITLNSASRHLAFATFEERPKRMFDESVRPVVMAMLKEVDGRLVELAAEREKQLAAMRAADARMKQDEQRRQEQVRVDALVHEMQQWELARRIRRFIRAVESGRVKNGLVDDPEGKVAAWYAWAKGVADKIDPLKPQS